MLPTRKTEFASKMIGFRPKTSLSLPHSGMLAAFASRYAEPVHAYRESGTWKSRDIEGSAVGIKTVSSAARKMLSVRAEKQSSVGKEGRPAVGDATFVAVDVAILAGRKGSRRWSPFVWLRSKFAEELDASDFARLSVAESLFVERLGEGEGEPRVQVSTGVLFSVSANGADVVVVVDVAGAMMPGFPKRDAAAGRPCFPSRQMSVK